MSDAGPPPPPAGPEPNWLPSGASGQQPPEQPGHSQPGPGQPGDYPPGTPAQQPSPGRAVYEMPVPFPEPVTYPHLLRTVEFDREWWRAPIGVVISAAWFLLGGAMFALPVLLIALAIEIQFTGQPYDDAVTKAFGDNLGGSPASLLWLNVALASITLVVWGLLRWLHHLRPKWLNSVERGVRWRYLWATMGLAVVVLIVQMLLSLLVPGGGEDVGGTLNHLGGKDIAMAIVVLLTTPLQALGEEVAFRGYLLLTIGSVLGWMLERMNLDRRRALTIATYAAVLLTSLLFALAHGTQNFPLFFDRFSFGLVAGILVVRTGGLEAGIALHVVNNVFAFALALLFGDVAESLNVSVIPWSAIILTLVQNGLFLVMALWLAKKMGLKRHTPGLSERVVTSATS